MSCWLFQLKWQVNPETGWRRKQVLVSVVAADALVLKHQTISIHNTDSIPVVPVKFNEAKHSGLKTSLYFESEITLSFNPSGAETGIFKEN